VIYLTNREIQARFDLAKVGSRFSFMAVAFGTTQLRFTEPSWDAPE